MTDCSEFLGGGVVLYAGDCMEVLKTFEENSVDSIVTDPPYGLQFMGKDWDKLWRNSTGADTAYMENTKGKLTSRARKLPDYSATNPQQMQLWHEQWAREVLRVLKPGGHMVAFSGTRTQHRMVCAIEDAGFEIKDLCAWVTGQGFPKAHNLKNYPICSCNVGGNSPSYIHGEQIPECDLRSMRNADVSAPEYTSKERGKVLQQSMQEQGTQKRRSEGTKSKTCNGEQPGLGRRELHRTRQGLSNDLKKGSSKGEGERIRVGAHLSGGEDVGASIGAWRGSTSQGSQQSEQRSEQSGDLREPLGSLDDGALFGRGSCPRCGKLRKELEGFSTALKPAWEVIALCRKPLSEPNIYENVLRWGTGAINVDGCRVGVDDGTRNRPPSKPSDRTFAQDKWTQDPANRKEFETNGKARWPANIVHDGSEEVLAGFPDSKSTGGKTRNGFSKHEGWDRPSHKDWGPSATQGGLGDSGSAARFFASFPEEVTRFKYNSKASKADRAGSSHPTVKPVALIQWLCRLITPPGGRVLDMFAGTGTTGEAAYREGFSAVLIEREAEYCADIGRRMSLVMNGKESRKHASAKARNKTESVGPLFDDFS